MILFPRDGFDLKGVKPLYILHHPPVEDSQMRLLHTIDAIYLPFDQFRIRIDTDGLPSESLGFLHS
ncbi:MAG: hypothetical protein Q7V12_08970 [Deltaproteobacteria bacterium]|nr:hypothetical protein [Deltaproteobacteria bacterium]MDO9350296.1 hypothetical protein [Deltaproteobacteria bacterium]